MKLGIIASDRSEWHVNELQQAFRLRGAECYVFPVDDLVSRIGLEPRVSVKGYSVDDYNLLIIRKVPGGSPEQVFYRMDVLHSLEEMGVYVVNSPDSIEKSVDKYYTSAILNGAGISTPRTIVTEDFQTALRAFQKLGGDVVVKPLFGSLGTGITRVSNPDIAYRVFRALERVGSVFYLQEFIPHKQTDIRAFVLDNQVVSAMQRVSDVWKTNLSLGGVPKKFQLDEELEEMSIKASEIIGLEYAGVDILISEEDEKAYVVEVNSTPGWRGLQKVTDVKISDRITDYLLSRLY